MQKGEDTGTEDTHRESTEDAQEAPHENTSYIKVETGKTGKGRSTHRLTEDKRSNYPEEKTGKGRPKTEGKRRTTDKKTARD